MTKKYNNGSKNQSSPRGEQDVTHGGDNSKGNKRNKTRTTKEV
jgi:hypothetical protein